MQKLALLDTCSIAKSVWAIEHYIRIAIFHLRLRATAVGVEFNLIFVWSVYWIMQKAHCGRRGGSIYSVHGLFKLSNVE